MKPDSTIRDFILRIVDVRVPRMNDLYIDKLGHVNRCKEEKLSKRAQKRTIVKESWLVRTEN